MKTKKTKTTKAIPAIEEYVEPVDDYTTIYERISRGDYKTKLEYPGKPARPAILIRPAGELTDEELRSLPEIRQAYEQAQLEQKRLLDLWRADDGILQDRFTADLETYYGLPSGDPFVGAMHGVAYERGHSGGYSEIACAMADLMPLWEAHQAALVKAVAAAKGGAS